MSLFFGSRQKTKPQFSSLQVQSSSNNLPLPLVWGLTRLAPNLMWYGDFKSHKQKAGGKGGGGKGGTTYTYSASLQMALCQGPSTGVQKVFRDNEKDATLSSLGLTFFDGSDPQDPWAYLVAQHPEAALSYPGTVHVDKANYDLGTSASLPQHSFVTECLRYDTQVGGNGDADPALCVLDLLTLPVGGCGFPESLIDMDSLLSGPDAPTTGDSAFQTYCQAMGLGMSPALTSQEEALTVLERWGKLMNTAVIWNGANLKFSPYGLQSVTGNGVTFIPVTGSTPTPVYTLTDADYISGGGFDGEGVDPVIITRRNPSDVKNRLQLEILNRSKEYNAVPIEWVEQSLVDQFGDRQDAVFNAHEICEPAMATTIVALMGQRNAYRGNNQYKFKLSSAFCLVEPMDALTMVDPILGTIDVQVDRIEEDEDYNLEFTCSQLLVGSTDSGGFTPPDQTPTGNNTSVDPGPVNPPIIFQPSAVLSNDVPQVWAAVSGGDGTDVNDNWGGCFVWVSSDDATYQQIGEITQPARMGKTTTALASYVGTNPDTAHTVGVNLQESGGELTSVSSDDASTFTTLCYLDGELLSYMDATLTSANHYTLGGELYRGLYGTTAGAHLTGTDFARLDTEIFKYDLPAQYVGVPLYFKFQSYNIFGGAVQDLSDCVAYPYTPVAPIGVNGVIDDTGATDGDGLEYDATTGTWVPVTPEVPKFGFAFQRVVDNITVSEPFAFFDTPTNIPWTLPSGAADCQGTIGGTGATAPSAQTDFDIQSPPGTSIGTMRFASGSLTATFIKAANTAIPGGQPIQLVAPANLNGIAGTLFGSIVGQKD